jgi:hypothetical protein
MPPSNLLNLNPVHIMARHNVTPTKVAGMIRCIVKSYDSSVIDIGATKAAIPIESNGSVIFEPIKVPIATP